MGGVREVCLKCAWGVFGVCLGLVWAVFVGVLVVRVGMRLVCIILGQSIVDVFLCV